ncbi:MAG TPA: spore germination protein GerW family protein [Actinomycetes bacterium]|nr:spore germination protein GerW family protein [Actinomycetes bacterium]
MEVQDVIAQARDAITVKRVFGEPYEKDGVTVIPAAKVQGGAGGGGGEDPEGQAKGSGSGFGVSARPVGAFVIRGGEMSWQPALDLNRVILGGQVVAVVLLLTIRSIAKRRAKTRGRGRLRRARTRA